MAQRFLRPLSYGDLFDETFELYKSNFVTLAGISAGNQHTDELDLLRGHGADLQDIDGPAQDRADAPGQTVYGASFHHLGRGNGSGLGMGLVDPHCNRGYHVGGVAVISGAGGHDCRFVQVHLAANRWVQFDDFRSWAVNLCWIYNVRYSRHYPDAHAGICLSDLCGREQVLLGRDAEKHGADRGTMGSHIRCRYAGCRARIRLLDGS